MHQVPSMISRAPEIPRRQIVILYFHVSQFDFPSKRPTLMILVGSIVLRLCFFFSTSWITSECTCWITLKSASWRYLSNSFQYLAFRLVFMFFNFIAFCAHNLLRFFTKKSSQIKHFYINRLVYRSMSNTIDIKIIDSSL